MTGFLRADSGFPAGKFLKYLESLCLNYMIGVKKNPYLKNEICGITSWNEQFANGISLLYNSLPGA